MADNTLVPHVALVESQISPWGKKREKYSDFWTEAFGNQSRKASSVDLKRAFPLPGDALGFCCRDFETLWNLSGFVSACWERSRLPGQGGELCFLAQPFASSLPWLGAWLPRRARCGSLGQGEPGKTRQRRY